MVERFDHPFAHKSVQVGNICDHPGCGIDFTGKAHFNRVIVAMTVRIVAFAINAAIFFFTEFRAVKTMRRGKVIPAAKFDVK